MVHDAMQTMMTIKMCVLEESVRLENKVDFFQDIFQQFATSCIFHKLHTLFNFIIVKKYNQEKPIMLLKSLSRLHCNLRLF